MSMKNYVSAKTGVNKLNTPQNEKADPRQVENSAKGFSFEVDDWAKMDRFLILGTEAGSYYAGAKEMTTKSAAAVERCLAEDGIKAVARIAEISVSGRAVKNTPAIFALAMACASKDDSTRKAAFLAIPQVCRIGTHLFEFMTAVRTMRGLGKGLAKAITKWYTGKPADKLAFQLVKYQQREGMSHRDVLRLTRRHGARTELEPAVEASLRWVVAPKTVGLTREIVRRTPKGDVSQDYKTPSMDALPKILAAHDELVTLDPKDLKTACKLVAEHRLTHEMVPSHFLGKKEMWDTLLPHMPLGAMVRNLGRMTANELLAPMSDAERTVKNALTQERILKARLHPLQILLALTTYQRGRGVKGKLSWSPSRPIVDALDEAFYHSFGNVEPSGKRTLLALDVSGSMSFSDIAGMPGITPRVGSAAMAMITARTEKDWHCVGFCGARGTGSSWLMSQMDQLTKLDISPKQRLDDVVKAISDLPFGGTDCALPMQYAMKNKIKVDTFVIYTDSETWAGNPHPHQALKSYRNKMGIDARLVVVGMTANEFTIADPTDKGMLDVVGFDTATPGIISSFSKGEL
jgi:60 kDa SS-A/Ro ribonucleoprotein